MYIYICLFIHVYTICFTEVVSILAKDLLSPRSVFRSFSRLRAPKEQPKPSCVDALRHGFDAGMA